MTSILIVEGNTPDMVAKGHSGASGFMRTFASLSPEIRVRYANPYALRLSDTDLENVDGVVFTGSGVRWSVFASDGAAQCAAMELALSSGLPIWGSCNGLQLAMYVLGGTVGICPQGIEIGMARDLTMTPAGAAHPMMTGRMSGFGVPCVHRDEVQTLPEGAVLLAGNDHSRVQSVAYTQNGVQFWGTQYHPELSLPDIAKYVRGEGVFSGQSALADDLDAAEMDRSAAARLGTNPEALAVPDRCLELANWLEFVSDG